MCQCILFVGGLPLIEKQLYVRSFHKALFLWYFAYRYFEGGISSVYLWDLDHGFAGVVLIKKAGDGSQMIKGCWDSIHVVEVQVLTNFLNSILCYMLLAALINVCVTSVTLICYTIESQ